MTGKGREPRLLQLRQDRLGSPSMSST